MMTKNCASEITRFEASSFNGMRLLQLRTGQF